MSTWVFIAILVLGAIVTYIGLQVGGVPREDPGERDAADAAPFTSMREPGAEPEDLAPEDRAAGARRSLEERLRERADERARAARPPEPLSEPAPASPAAQPLVRLDAEVPSQTEAPPVTVVRPPDPEVPRAIELRPIDPERRAAFAQRWSRLSPALTLSPAAAVADVDELVRDLLVERGLPSDPEDPALAIAAVDHGDVVDPFRLATSMARAAGDDRASAADLRQAALHYRNAVERLLTGDDVRVG